MNEAGFYFTGDYCVAQETVNVQETLRTNGSPLTLLKEKLPALSKLTVNLECPITDADRGIPHKWANLKSPTTNQDILDGLDLAILGNNHIGDFGVKGATDTVEVLNKLGVQHCGFGKSIADASLPQYLTIGEKVLGVISLCCPTTNSEFIATHESPGVALVGMEIIEEAISVAKPKCDALVIYMHWGVEWVHQTTVDQMRLARHAIDCGADAIIGCHSHTIQAFEKYKGRWIFYGLGNFLFSGGEAVYNDQRGLEKRVPLMHNLENRQSMIVGFQIQEDMGNGCLDLSETIFSEFGPNDLSFNFIEKSQLVVDLDFINSELTRFTSFSQKTLKNRKEVKYQSSVRNGVLMYSYNSGPVVAEAKSIALVKHYLKYVKRKFLSLQSRVRKKVENKLLNLKIGMKWSRDKKILPLRTNDKKLFEIIHRYYYSQLGHFPNLINPEEFNDKIQWLKLFDQQELMIKCSDKLLVREFIEERVGNSYLAKVYDAKKHFSEIDFDALPDDFVVKTNHDSGSVALVRDKKNIDLKRMSLFFERNIRKKYGIDKGEWGYQFIEPMIFVEEHLCSESDIPPPDFKFYVVDGSARFCHFIYDRDFDTKEQTVDIDGRDLKTELYPSFKLGHDFQKPKEWEEMVHISEKLGAGFKCVRVDMFNINGRITIGEMTFWPMAGCYQGEGQKKMGTFLDFNLNTYNQMQLE